MIYRRRLNTDVNKVIYLVKDSKTGLYREASEQEKIGKTKSGGQKRRRKKTQRRRKYKKKGGGNLVQVTEEQKIGKKTEKRTFKLRKVNEPVLLTGDLSNTLAASVIEKAPPAVVAKPVEKAPAVVAPAVVAPAVVVADTAEVAPTDNAVEQSKSNITGNSVANMAARYVEKNNPSADLNKIRQGVIPNVRDKIDLGAKGGKTIRRKKRKYKNKTNKKKI